MGVRQGYRKPSRFANKSKRWPALRLKALRRDGWQCVQCGSKLHLQVDHILPVRDRRDLAFDLSNLQTLCGLCHGQKTRIEMGGKPLNPEQIAWRKLVNSTMSMEI